MLHSRTRSPKGLGSDRVNPSLNSRLGCSRVPEACFVRGPPGLADALRCEVADAHSSLMVRGSEELVSSVIRIQVQDGARLHFPVTVVVPFSGSYRGSYRDVLVKVVDERGGRSYVTPLATEGTYGGHWVRFRHGFGPASSQQGAVLTGGERFVFSRVGSRRCACTAWACSPSFPV